MEFSSKKIVLKNYYPMGDRHFLTAFDHCTGLPQKGSKIVVCQKWMPSSNFSCEITYLCKFAASSHHFQGNGQF